MPPRLLFVGNDGRTFVSHRIPVARAAQRAGYEVHVAVPAGPSDELLRAEGFFVHSLPLGRKSLNPFREVRTLLALRRLYRRIRPDIVHHLTVKPIVYGGMAARLAQVPSVVHAVTGLGFVYSSSKPLARFLRPVVSLGFRVAFGHPNVRTIFQNPDDRQRLLDEGLDGNGIVILGSGVDPDAYPELPEPSGTPLVVLPARMLWGKGVAAFVEAARSLHAKGLLARFALVGDTDPGNPDAVPSVTLEQWQREGIVEWWGWRADMVDVFAQAHVVCLPTSYGEGVPRVLIEAASCGRAIVTTDTPGCREIVREGKNGRLVPVEDVNALAAAVEEMIRDPLLRQEFGVEGRRLVLAEFTIERVVSETLAVYRGLRVSSGDQVPR